MELVKKLKGHYDHKGKYREISLFKCGYCKSEVIRNGYNGRKQKSCGCASNDYGHKLSGTRIYRVWASMKDRCSNKNTSAFKNYGGRGITLCEEWKSFTLFNNWALSHGYKENLQIDRINNDGNYCPENCRFVTHAQNCRNTRYAPPL